MLPSLVWKEKAKVLFSTIDNHLTGFRIVDVKIACGFEHANMFFHQEEIAVENFMHRGDPFDGNTANRNGRSSNTLCTALNAGLPVFYETNPMRHNVSSLAQEVWRHTATPLFEQRARSRCCLVEVAEIQTMRCGRLSSSARFRFYPRGTLRIQYTRLSVRISKRSPAMAGVDRVTSSSARLLVCRISSVSPALMTEHMPSSLMQNNLPS